MLTAALAVTGCGGTDRITEDAVEDASNGEVKIDRDGDQTKIEVGGQEYENQQGGLADGFPKDVPIPDDFEVVSSTKGEGAYQAFGRIASSEDTFAFYEAELPKQGWKVNVAGSAGGSFQITADKDGRALVLGSAPSNEGANLTIVLR